MTATLTTLVDINDEFDDDGGNPVGSLIADSQGDLFGTTSVEAADGGVGVATGTVFEIVKIGAGYASTPTTLVSFTGEGDQGAEPNSDLIADANGDLFGTTSFGGANNDGTVFEIVKTPGGYASTPTTLVSFNDDNGLFPDGTLIADGNLFGTTFDGGANGDGTVFEIAKTPTGYASTPTTLVNFNGEDGSEAEGSLIADSNGDLFGTTRTGGANDDGTVFEIVKTAGGYASTPTILVSFNGTNGTFPDGSLIADSNGDLFGTTSESGANNDGTVFEIAKTASGYASAPTTLVSFNGADGSSPIDALIANPDGDLFGTTVVGGASGIGAVFEIEKTAAGYASAPTTVVSFNGGADGEHPEGGLIADANGDLFGTTNGGGEQFDDGTVFEITDGGFIPADSLLLQNAMSGQATIWDLNGNTLTGGGPVSPNPGPSWTEIGTGDFNHDSHADILWQNASTGQASIWEMNGNSLIDGGPVSPSPGPTWKAVGTGDFTDDGFSDDILWQNTSSGQVSVWEMSGNKLNGGGPVSPNPGPAWKAIGTGDFNHDGFSDVLFQNTSTGQVSIWEMHGNALIGGGPVSPNPGPAWRAVGTGDFNHDGFSDILFQNASSGQVSIWEMHGNTLMGGGPVSPNPGPSWHAIGTDGGSDILLQNTSGQASIWEISGNTLVGGGPVSSNPGTSWRAVGLT
jgi:uncharacterized repeat protein (TIGR03803 family)